MFRSFLGLWLLVFGPLFLLLYPGTMNPIGRFNEHIEASRYSSIHQGTFHLLEQALNQLPEAQWSKAIADMAAEFGFDINLLGAGELPASQGSATGLHDGEIVFVNAEPEYLLKRLDTSDSYLQLFVDFREEEKIRRGAQGTVFLLQQRLSGVSPAALPSAVEALNAAFPYKLRIQPRDRLKLNPTEQKHLNEGVFFWRRDAGQAVSFYIPLTHTSDILLAELIPLSSVDGYVVLLLILMFVVVISACMFFWVYPLWRELHKLAAATLHFGQGDLAVRAEVAKISVVGNLSRTFNRMAERTESLLHSQKTLTDAIAHDLRTPLYRMRFATEMLATEGAQDMQQKYLSSIGKSVDDIDHLLNQLLILSRYSDHQLPAQYSMHNVEVLLNDEVEAVAQSYPAIVCERQSTLTSAQQITAIDPNAMRRAMSNLLVNACKFASDRVAINLRFDEARGDYILLIEDDGPGIAEDEKERIFQPFEQLSNTARVGGAGHGLGLAIVRQIAQWHGGRVYAEDADLGGARLIFSWPMRQ